MYSITLDMYAQLLCNEKIVHIHVCASVLLSKSNYINLQNSIIVKGTSLLWMGHVTKMVSFYMFIHINIEVRKQKCRRWLSIIILPELNPSTLQHSEEKCRGAFNNIICLWSQILWKVNILSKTMILKDIHSGLFGNIEDKYV